LAFGVFGLALRVRFRRHSGEVLRVAIPAKAGIQLFSVIPAKAGIHYDFGCLGSGRASR
jgi:hypothetical protein